MCETDTGTLTSAPLVQVLRFLSDELGEKVERQFLRIALLAHVSGLMYFEDQVFVQNII
jgi:hypothetical protein